MTAHAKLSPSSAHRWMKCPGSIALESECKDTSSKFADEGTAAHFLASECLESGNTPSNYIGHTIVVDKGATTWLDVDESDLSDGVATFEVDAAMAEHVGTYVENVRDYASGNELMIEERVEFSDVIGVADSFGTSDAIIITSDYAEIQVHDLKYGMGVEVDAYYDVDGEIIPNEQMALYALGAIERYSLVSDFERVRLVIHQPRRSHLSEMVFTLDQIVAFGQQAKAAAKIVVHNVLAHDGGTPDADLDLHPGEKQCHFCKAKATCPALRSHVIATVTDDFEDLTQPLEPKVQAGIERIKSSDNSHLANCRNAVDLIEDWCSAVRAKTEAELLQGRAVGDYKLVVGRKGARKWVDAAAAEAMLKGMRLKVEQMYDLSLISPTTTEALHKSGAIGTRQWPKLQALITQNDGKPTVAAGSDKRAAIVVAPTVDDFEDCTLEELV